LRFASHGYGIVKPFVGHGIGTKMHEDPQVPNYRTGRRGEELQPGTCLAILEHTIAVMENGPEILTTIT
jgi:methionine aminopeptidase